MNYKFKIYKLKDEIDKYSVINTNQEISNKVHLSNHFEAKFEPDISVSC